MSDGDGPSTVLLPWCHSSHTNAQAQLQRAVFLQMFVLESGPMFSLGLMIKKDADMTVQRISMATCEHKEDGRGIMCPFCIKNAHKGEADVVPPVRVRSVRSASGVHGVTVSCSMPSVKSC
jgi:hypothetical protein